MSTRIVMFSIETLLKQTKRLETEKYEFEHREELKIKALFAIWTIRVPMPRTRFLVFQWNATAQ